MAKNVPHKLSNLAVADRQRLLDEILTGAPYAEIGLRWQVHETSVSNFALANGIRRQTSKRGKTSPHGFTQANFSRMTAGLHGPFPPPPIEVAPSPRARVEELIGAELAKLATPPAPPALPALPARAAETSEHTLLLSEAVNGLLDAIGHKRASLLELLTSDLAKNDIALVQAIVFARAVLAETGGR